jgi:MoxR-like ATPase
VTDELPLEEQLRQFRDRVQQLQASLRQAVVGQQEVINLLIASVFADGHVLLEGLPGLGKTLMVKSLAAGISLGFNRLQFTPDLMPADITGTTILATAADGARSFTFEPGPVFTNILLADEVNRAGPKTQSALLQAMQEHEVSLFGRHYPLPRPFLIFATQNPIELAGTYPLPEAQLDRFLFKVLVPAPTEEELIGIAERTIGTEQPGATVALTEPEVLAFQRLVRRIPVATPVLRGVTRGVLATRPEHPGAPAAVRRHVRHGVSPRGLQSLLLAAKVRACLDGRFNVSIEDVRPYWLPALRHRVILDPGAALEGVTADAVLAELGAALATA